MEHKNSMNPKRVKLAIVVSHPIQYFCPQYASWTSLPNVDLCVFFASKNGLEEYYDEQFGKVIKWQGMDLNFPHEFIPGAEERGIGNKIDADELDGLLSRFSPDILLVYGYNQPLLRRAMRWAHRVQIPVFMLSDAEDRSHRHWLKRLAKKVILPHFLSRVRLFLTVGDANEEYHRHYGVRDEHFVRCFFPIDRKAFDATTDRDSAGHRLRSKLNIPAHHKVVINVGKLVPWKRQRDLVEFSNQLQGKRDDITVILVGTGQDEADLRRLCTFEGTGGVIFTGFVQPDQLIDYYCAADIYAICASQEPHSLSISEAIYVGLPVIISDRCGSYGSTDDVRPGLNGFVYPCGDVGELSKLLLHVLDSDDLCARMSEASLSIGKHHQALAHGEALVQALAIVRTDSLSNK